MQVPVENAKTSPLVGVAGVQMLENPKGERADCVFLDVCPHFEGITGWRKKDVLNKKASELPISEPARLHWIAFVAEALQSGKPLEVTEWVAGMGKNLAVTAIPLAKDRCTIILRENTERASRLLAMFDQHSAIKLIYDPVFGKIVDANPAACRFYGYSREDLSSMMVQDINMLIPEQLQKQFHNKLNGESCVQSVPYRLKNGEQRLLDVYSSLLFTGGRQLVYSIIFDATDRERLRDELNREREWLRRTLCSIGDGVVATDNEGIITGLNCAALELTGWTREEAEGAPFSDVFVLRKEKNDKEADSLVQRVITSGKTICHSTPTELVSRTGKCTPIADSAAPIIMEDGHTDGVVMVFRDVSGEQEHKKQIEFMSYHDPLTGLFNRRYIEEKVIALDEAENLPLSILMGDVNGLKITNDVFGHKAGDALLQRVAELLKGACSENALISRWGGDEFLIVLPRTDAEEAEAVIWRVRNADVALPESGLAISISLGSASKTSPGQSVQETLREAEGQMYHQKLLDGRSYRNAIVNALLTTLYERSNETEEHSQRIEEYCHFIGRAIGLSSKEMDELSLLALLHDVGKVGIRRSILQKPGPLTAREWEKMRRHPEIGYRIAQATPELATVSNLILAHHERWDGTGYPQGLKGAEIPLISRIVAVADAFDAMTNDSPHRRAMSGAEALSELTQNAGTQFDPEIAGVFVNIMTNGEGGAADIL